MPDRKPGWSLQNNNPTAGTGGPPPQSTPATDAIEAALASLQNAEIPAGLEQRVLRGIELRQAQAAARSGWARPWFFPALATLAALFLLAVGISHRHRQPAPIAKLIPPAMRLSQPQAFIRSFPTAPSTLHPQHAAATTAKPSLATSAPAAQVEPAQVEEDHPAPELPLTKQERLLIRIAYGPQPQQQLALLHRNGMRLRPPADDDFDFNAFFEPYTTPLTQAPQGDPQ